MKTIIVATDFSPSAINAMNYAADMAIDIGAAIHLLHVYQLPMVLTDTPVFMMSVDELKAGAIEQLEKTKQGLEHVTSGKVPISSEAVMGDVVDEIMAACDKHKPFAVIMGAVGHNALERSLFGSSTLLAFRHANAPVFAIPTGKEYGKGIRKIGLAVDLHDDDGTPGELIKDMVHTLKAELHILNVDDDNEDISPEISRASSKLSQTLEGIPLHFHFLDDDDIEESINDFAVENNLDLVIVLPKKHTLFDGFFKKSNTKEILFHTSIPVAGIRSIQ